MSFSESNHFAYQIKGNTEHHESKYAVITHTLDHMWWGQKVFFFFSESDHVAYQIKVEAL